MGANGIGQAGSAGLRDPLGMVQDVARLCLRCLAKVTQSRFPQCLVFGCRHQCREQEQVTGPDRRRAIGDRRWDIHIDDLLFGCPFIDQCHDVYFDRSVDDRKLRTQHHAERALPIADARIPDLNEMWSIVDIGQINLSFDDVRERRTRRSECRFDALINNELGLFANLVTRP